MPWSQTCARLKASPPQPSTLWRCWLGSGRSRIRRSPTPPRGSRASLIRTAECLLFCPPRRIYPHAPWMVPSDGGSQLTFAIAGALWEAGSSEPWLRRGTEWCWAKLQRLDGLSACMVKFSLDFLDSVPDQTRANAAIEGLHSRINANGSMPVPGGSVVIRPVCGVAGCRDATGTEDAGHTRTHRVPAPRLRLWRRLATASRTCRADYFLRDVRSEK